MPKIESWEEILQDRLLGCLLGVAIGDAMGMPTEWMNRQNVETSYPDGISKFESPAVGHRHYGQLEAGDFTDDTWLTLVLLRSIARQNGFDELHFKKELARWWQESEALYDRGAGPTTKKAASLLAENLDQVVSSYSPSCGPAIRVSSIGLLWAGELESAFDDAVASAKITHSHPTAHLVAGVVASIISKLVVVEGRVSSIDFFKELHEILEGCGKKYGKRKESGFAFKQLVEQLAEVEARLKFESFKKVLPYANSSNASDVLCSAFGYLYVTGGDFKRTALLAACGGGDADSIASIACAVAGVICGYEAIPGDWKKEFKTKNRKEIKDLNSRGKTLSKQVINRLRDNPPSLQRWVKPSINETKLKKTMVNRLKKDGVLRLPTFSAEKKTPLAVLDELAHRLSSERDNIIRVDDRPIMVFLNKRGFHLLPRIAGTLSPEQNKKIEAELISNLDRSDINIRNTAAATLLDLKSADAIDKLRENKLDTEANKLAQIVWADRIQRLAEQLSQYSVEGEPIRLRIVIGDQQHVDKLKQDPTVAPLKADLKQDNSDSHVLKGSLGGGLMFVNLDGIITGNYETLDKEEYRFFAPISDGLLVKLAQENDLIVFSISSYTSKVYRFQNTEMGRRRTQEVEHKLRGIVNELGLDWDLVSYVSSLAHEISMKSRHGAVLCMLPQEKITDEKDGGDWYRVGSNLSVRKWKAEKFIARASQDKATMIDSNTGSVLGYGYHLKATEVAQKKVLKLSGDVLRTHGTRHSSSAGFSFDNRDSLVIVISERGTITYFARGEVVVRYEKFEELDVN